MYLWTMKTFGRHSDSEYAFAEVSALGAPVIFAVWCHCQLQCTISGLQYPD